MRIDHCRFDVGVAQVVLDLPYVHAIEKTSALRNCVAMYEPRLAYGSGRASGLFTAFWTTDSSK